MTSRSITGLVLAAILTAPVAAHAQSRRTAAPPSNGSGIWLGGMFGLEAGNDSGYQLRFDGEFPIARLVPNLQLSGVGSASLAGLSSNKHVLEFVPAARFTWFATPQLGAYGDVGLGLFDEWQGSTSNVGATLRLGAGGYYEINSTTRLFAELGLHPHFGDYNDTTFTMLIGAKFKI
ncbi:MAG TPA: hypothetical protein VMU15_10135 [Anaeromyxobacter sp.]|nr:hypothetical protein [Anaeromyxobacter sp.]